MPMVQILSIDTDKRIKKKLKKKLEKLKNGNQLPKKENNIMKEKKVCNRLIKKIRQNRIGFRYYRDKNTYKNSK